MSRRCASVLTTDATGVVAARGYRNQRAADEEGHLLAARRENRFHEFFGNRVGNRRVRVRTRPVQVDRLPAVRNHAARAVTEVMLEL